MNSFKEKFKIAKILASLFTHSSTPEEEKMYKEWIEGHPENSELGTRILNQENYERNNRLLQQFPSHNAWIRIKPLLDNRQIKFVQHGHVPQNTPPLSYLFCYLLFSLYIR